MDKCSDEGVYEIYSGSMKEKVDAMSEFVDKQDGSGIIKKS